MNRIKINIDLYQSKTYHCLFLHLALLSLLLNVSCAVKPPAENGNFKTSDLVELVKIDSSIHLDIRYATNNNFAGRPLYKQARAFLQRPAAEALARANKQLKPIGYGLLVFDAYRPWSITKILWDITSEENKKFVANPKNGSRHNRGCAVDVSLYEIKTGKEVEMTGLFDEMSERSTANYSGGTTEQRVLRDLLRHTMEGQGFTVLADEWWHFDFKDWRSYGIENVSFESIK